MNIKYALGGLALVASAASFGQIVTQGHSAGGLDNRSVVLAGLHSTDELGFIDIFEFSVTGPGVALAQFSDVGLGTDGVSFQFNTVLLADGASVPLPGSFSVDTDGGDGWLVFADLPGAGTYRVITGGAVIQGPGAGYYLGAVGTLVPSAVPEPTSYGLLLLGLGVIGWVGQRKVDA